MHEAMIRAKQVATREVVRDRTTRRVIAVAAFAVATALGARVAVPLTPVPVTLQTLFVILSGAVLGARLGAASQLGYLAMGVAGLPVFAAGIGPGALVGPTGGYLLAFPATAWASGVAARHAKATVTGAFGLFVGLFLASLITLGGGAAWLAVLTGDGARAVALGFTPFLAGDLIKVGLATLIAWRVRDRTLGLL